MNGFDNGNKLPFMSPFFKTTVYNYAIMQSVKTLVNYFCRSVMYIS